MPCKDYRAYAQSEKGKAARARAHAKYIEKRRTERASIKVNAAPLSQAIKGWRL